MPRFSALSSASLPRPLRVALYAAACLVLLYMALAPTRDVPGADLVWDKAEHAGAWMVLTVLGLLLSTRRRWAVGVFALVFGVVIEVLQSILPFGRDGELSDLVADGLGIAAAYGLWWIARRLGWVR
ncbi:MAG: VanZ family protein [Phenylobacterium sp.]